MTSKISFFNLMKEDMRRRIWMAVLSLLGNILAYPVFFMLARQRYMDYASRPIERSVPENGLHMNILAEFFARFFTNEANLSGGIILVAGAAIVAVFGFRYLYSRKMADTFHSLPVTRSRLFFAGYFNGLLIWLIPFLVSVACTLALAFSEVRNPVYFGIIAKAAGKNIVVCLIAFLMVYHLFLLSVMVSGNVLNAMVSALIMGVAVAGIYELLCYLLLNCMITYLTPPIVLDKIIWTSPLLCAVKLLELLGTPLKSTNFLTGWQSSGGLSGNLFLPAASILLAAVNLLAAWKFYLKRPSELAERGVDNKTLCIALSFAGTLTMGLTGASLFTGILNYFTASLNTTVILGWRLFGTVLFSLLTFGTLNIIFRMDIKAFFRKLPHMILSTVLSLLLVLAIAQDWIGFNTRYPNQNQVFSASVSVTGFNDTNEGTYLELFDSSKMDYRDLDTLYRLLDSLVSFDSAGSSDVLTNVKIKLQKTNGGNFYRNYPVYQKDVELLRPILESKEFLQTYYPISCGILLPEKLFITDVNKDITYTVDDISQVTAIMEAYQRDFQKHTSLEELANGIIIGDIQLYLYDKKKAGYQNIYVRDNYSETIRVLQEQEKQMVTTLDDIPISSVTLTCALDDNMPKAALFSYFQLEGYPAYQELAKEYNSRPENGLDSTAVMESSSLNPLYEITISDPDAIKELLPYLHIGNNFYRSDMVSQQFIEAGLITDTAGRTYTCYVDAGRLPEKWINAMEQSN